jgi:hypothetical protein
VSHHIVSFYQFDLPLSVVKLQRAVFKKFGHNVLQLGWHRGQSDHAGMINDYLHNNTDWTSITLVDADCVPFRADFLDKALDYISDDNTLYGNIQASNVNSPDPAASSPPFIAPSFVNFTRKFWEESNCKNFAFTRYDNPVGVSLEADVGEAFTRENEKQGRRIIYAYPTYCPTDYTWKYTGNFDFKPFAYGNATEFESGMFHCFQVRIPDKRELFYDYCLDMLLYP